MARPTAFDRQTSFALFTSENPGVAHSGVDIDAEFNAVKVASDETQELLNAITDDDGSLARGTVGRAQLASDIVLGVAPPALWAATTDYVVDESVVFNSLKLYIANTTHTSGATFDASKWDLLADFSATAQIGDGDITTEKLDDDAVTVDKLADNAVETAKLDTAAVTTPKIADLNVTTGKIANEAVTTAKIDDGAVTAAKIGAGEVETANIDDLAVTAAKLGAAAVETAKIKDDNVTFAKLDDAAFGTGIEARSSKYIAPGFAPAAAFSKLAIKVASNTTVSVAADYVTTTDGTKFQTTALSATIDMATVGANGLDAGTIAAATWYAIWAISKEDGTTAALASTSFTAPTLPSGYTRKARIGAVRTAAGSAQLLGTWQFGRRAQYVVGLAQTSLLPLIDDGISGTYSTTSPTLLSVSIATFVPTTAVRIAVGITTRWKNSGGAAAGVLVAPSTSYGGTNNGPVGSVGMLWPAWVPVATHASIVVDLLLESTSIGWASENDGGALFCAGWEDNL